MGGDGEGVVAGFEPGAVQPGGRRAGCKDNSPRQTVVNLGSSIKAYYSTSREYRVVQPVRRPPRHRPGLSGSNPSRCNAPGSTNGLPDEPNTPPKRRLCSRGHPAHVRPSSRPERRKPPGRSGSIIPPHSPPRSGIHTAASSCRGSACRIKAPCSVPYHRRRGVFLFAEVCQSGDPPARRQPTPQLSTTTTTTSSTTTSQPSPPSAAAADLQGNQLGPWSAADIGYTRTHPPGYHHHHHHHHSGGPTPTHPPTPPYTERNRGQIFSSEFLPENCARLSG